MEFGRIVRSKAGSDKGKFMVVVKVNDKRVYVVDGKKRKLDNPKPKNPIHIAVTAAKLDDDELSSNRILALALSKYAQQKVSREES